jgi:hypothetical protein
MTTPNDIEAREEAKIAIDENGKTYTVTTKVNVNDPATGKVVQTPTPIPGVKGTPPSQVSEWEGETLVGTGFIMVIFAALDLVFVPVKGVDVQFDRNGLTQHFIVEKVIDHYSGDLIAIHECLLAFQGEE